ncbi:hypothetical protein [Paenibacillus sp. NPDC055715]
MTGKRIVFTPSVLSLSRDGLVVTSDMIQAVYGVEVIVRQDAEAGMYLIPIGVGASVHLQAQGV